MTRKRLALPKNPKIGNEQTIARRTLLKIFAGGAFCMTCWPHLLKRAMAADDSVPRQFRWRVPQAHADTVSKELRFDGQVATEKDAKGVPLVFIFAGAVLLPYLAKAVLALRREIVHGGVIIDTRGEEIRIDTDKSLSGGVIIIVSTNGTELYERDENGDPSELVTALMQGLKM